MSAARVGAVIGLLAGCAPAGTAPDDEALARERARGGVRPVHEVAGDFWPARIDNYFEGMDSIAVQPGGDLDPLRAPVSQLLDRTPPRFRPSEDPVRTPSEIMGRDSWMIWCGGNEGFWDWLAGYAGLTDLLKLIDSRERATRFEQAGLINEPEMTAARAPDRFGLWLDTPVAPERRAFRARFLAQAFGSDDPAWSDEEPAYGATPDGTPPPPPEIYGLSSGVVGLRLFPNPEFVNSKAAQQAWDAERYYGDESYYSDPDLVRPYRVGMACAFCHASYHPLEPPRDLVNPRWENISGNIGAQYLRIRAVFGNLLTEDNFLYHLLDSQPPGTIDTSLIPSDNINNTNAMNSVFNVPQRVVLSLQNPKEDQAAASQSQPSVWGNPKEAKPAGYDDRYDLERYRKDGDRVPRHLWSLFEQLQLLDELENSNSDPRRVPRILLDGADSIGAWGALARVYLNIGTYWEQWQRLHTPLFGFTPQSPFSIAECERHSAYWHATQDRVGPIRDYFLKITPPMPLLATDGAEKRIVDSTTGPTDPDERPYQIDKGKLARGRDVFAGNCLVCHSSIQPETFHVDPHTAGCDQKEAERRELARLTAVFAFGDQAPDAEARAAAAARAYHDRYDTLAERRYERLHAFADPTDAHGDNEFWYHDPEEWVNDDEYIQWAREVVEVENFWRFNYLSVDYRIPINVVGTNSARAMATNAIAGNMWSDFSSRSYQSLPPVGEIDFFNPYVGENGGMDRYTPRHALRQSAPDGVPAGGGGPGFYRAPTLVSIWATAPLLHNNSLGLYIDDPARRISVDGRLEMFDDAIRKLLWPERRRDSSSFNGATPERLKRDHGLIWRTPRETYLVLAASQIPAYLGRVPVVAHLRGRILEWFPWLATVRPLWLPSAVLLIVAFIGLRFGRGRWWRYLCGYCPMLAGVFLGLLLYLFNGKLGNLRIGPIPAGTPVNLLANTNPDASFTDLREALTTTISALSQIESRHLLDETDDEEVSEEGRKEARRLMREEAAPALMKVSKCPDFVMDKGHYFGWFKTMTDEDKDALIELLKTF